VSTEFPSPPDRNQLPETARDVARQTADEAKEAVHRANAATEACVEAGGDMVRSVADLCKDTAHRATDVAKDMYHTASVKAEETLETSKEYVRRNPVPVVLGAVAIGAAIGYSMVSSRRRPTFSEHYVEEPLAAIRGALLTALTPVSQRVHEGYESALDGLDHTVHRMKPRRAARRLSDRICRAGNHLKFW
jgi:ElaB/YqjD/DUF883 family membrane-anchored ribosome-binding protein